jgi:iron(III) transport system ATP-binding protein
MSAVQIRHVTKTYAGRPPVPALRGVSLDVPEGSLVAVLGPSGCGKTTLLRVLAGFERPDGGTVTIGDTLVADGGKVSVPPERRHVGIVPQEGALFPHLDVGANVGFGLTKLPARERAARVAELLELVGLAGYERRRPHELSGGQQQRVALARALAPAPAVVLLDEPFAALDTGLRAAVREEVASCLTEAGTTAVLVTHDQTEALTMADTVAVMRDGVIVQSGAPDEIYRAPADLDTARFLGDVVVLRGDLTGGGVATFLGHLPAAGPSGPVDVLLRPEQIVRDPSSATAATVRAIHYHGHDALVELDVASHLVLARWTTVDLPAPGDVLTVGVAGPPAVFPATGLAPRRPEVEGDIEAQAVAHHP